MSTDAEPVETFVAWVEVQQQTPWVGSMKYWKALAAGKGECLCIANAKDALGLGREDDLPNWVKIEPLSSRWPAVLQVGAA